MRDVDSKISTDIDLPASAPSGPPSRKFTRKAIINRLNYINFSDKSIEVLFQHPRFDHRVTLRARPEPTLNGILACRWENPGSEIESIVKSYHFQGIAITEGNSNLLIKPTDFQSSGAGFTITLPEFCTQTFFRRIQRDGSVNIHVRILQNGISFEGTLIDFSAHTFQIEVRCLPPQSFSWLVEDDSITIIFSNVTEILFTGICTIQSQSDGETVRRFIISPVTSKIQRFLPKEFRSKRQFVEPAPHAIFNHPLTDKTIVCKVADLSGSGFSVLEDPYKSMIIPGLIFPKITLVFPGNLRIDCRAQAIYTSSSKDLRNQDLQKSGLAILDIDINRHEDLMSFLWQYENSKNHLGFPLDLDSLWAFFFETGFIYPEKYALLFKAKDRIKSVFNRLYTQSPKIARHFTYTNDTGDILSHMAMIRLYNFSWMIHHHAAHTAASFHAGIEVLKQIGRFINESHQLQSIHMKYVFCYYRAESRFPNKVFGGACKHINNQEGCISKPLGYRFWRCEQYEKAELPYPWEITPASDQDLTEFSMFAANEGLGLPLKAFDMGINAMDQSALIHEYESIQCRKERFLWSLRYQNKSRAIFIVDVTDAGMNLSELTNCIKVFILDDSELRWEIFTSALQNVIAPFKGSGVPILTYPHTAFTEHGYKYDKIYNLWILNMKFTDAYFEFIEKIMLPYALHSKKTKPHNGDSIESPN